MESPRTLSLALPRWRRRRRCSWNLADEEREKAGRSRMRGRSSGEGVREEEEAFRPHLPRGSVSSQQMRTWMKEVREVSYDAEDCIDIFYNHLSKHSDSRGLARRMHKAANLLRTLKLRDKLATDIQRLKLRALDVSNRRLRYRLDAAEVNCRSGSMLTSSSYVEVDRWLPAIYGDASRLVGMDEKTKDIIGMLTAGGVPRLRVAIVGFGGLGKTSLAVAAYNSPLLRAFQCHAFVPVSHAYDLRLVLESLVKQLVLPPIEDDGSTRRQEDPLLGIESWDIDGLIKTSIRYLQDKRYLVVLDDVWRPSTWEHLKVAFPDNGKESRILVTTRSQPVATSCCTSINDIYVMRPLSREDSEK